MATPLTEVRHPEGAPGGTVSRLPPSPLSPPARARLVAEVVGAYAQARRELRRAPIEEVVAALRADETQPAVAAAGPHMLREARRLGWIVARTLRWMPGDTRCLARSLVLTRLLARRGIPAKLVIGARAAPEFLAHAWVECDGQPVLSPGDGSFSRLVEL
jgi:Transglutaminase-like superfamily